MSGVEESLERLKAEQAEKHKVRDRNNAILAGQKDNLDKRVGEMRNGKSHQSDDGTEQAGKSQQASIAGPSAERRVATVVG